MQLGHTSHAARACGVLSLMSDRNHSITEYTDLQIYEVCVLYQWNLGKSAKHLGVTRTALKDRVERTPDLVVAMQDAEEEMIDDAEDVIRAEAKSDSATARFVAQTKGKNRGWGTAGVNKDGAIIVEVRQFADPGAKDGSKG